MYNFTSFAMVLNEVDKDMESLIPKTDCRLRPDIRAMENGEIGNKRPRVSRWRVILAGEGGDFVIASCGASICGLRDSFNLKFNLTSAFI